ncbi:MAG TPA: S24 family peptidase [Gammaproteobacteria bacterium]|nr:S24 family peptidase [Gammaproteobacteria bacterium]
MTTATTLPISEILTRLLFKRRLRATELARQLNLPQPTISRILTGATANPHRSSLEPIADFFNISVQQLKGLEPIPWLEPNNPQATGWTEIPIYDWQEAASAEHPEEAEKKLFTDAAISEQGFALIMKDASMEPQFPKNTLLIVDPARTPKDRSFVVVKLENYPEVVFRQLILDGPDHYLKPTSPDFERFKMTLMGSKDKIIGVLVQTRKNYEE